VCKRSKQRDDRNQDESCDQTQVFEEGVQRHEAMVSGHRPEIVGGEHGDGGQHAEAAGANLQSAPDDHQGGTREFDGDGRRRPEPRRLQVRLLRDGTGNRSTKYSP